MSCGSLDVTLVSASISPNSFLECEPCDTYAVLKCAQQQHRTKTAQDHGRLPVWNETFAFEIQEQDMSSELLVQVFNVERNVDELLGVTRISIFAMVGKEEATLSALVNSVQGEIGKLKAVWKWKPRSQTSLKATSRVGDSNVVAYPRVPNPSLNTSGPFSKLEAVSDALAKLSMEKGSGRYSASYPEDTGNFCKEQKAQGGDYYAYPPASGAYPVANPPISETCARDLSDHRYPPPVSDAYPPHKDAYPPRSSGTFPPPSDAYPPNNQGYPPYPGSAYPPPQHGAYPPDSGAYPPYPGSANPLSQHGAYAPDSGAYPLLTGAYPPRKDSYPPYPGSENPPHPDPYSAPGILSEGFGYMEKGGGDKEKGKGHGSHSSYGQPPPAGYPPSSYPPAPPAGYPPYGHPPTGGYPPAPHGYPPAPHGYPPAPHGYPQGFPPASHGYPPTSHGYPPAGYPPQGYPAAHSAPPYPPQGYPASGHESGGHKPGKHGSAAGSYVGHSSSCSKPSKKHKEHKQSSSHKSNKHKKQKSFKGMKFKKFKMFKF